MTALPKATETQLTGNALSAYNVCLHLEEIAEAKTGKELIQARVLGYLIICAPSTTAVSELVNVIESCNNDPDKLFGLGKCFINYYIRPCKSLQAHFPLETQVVHLNHQSRNLRGVQRQPPLTTQVDPLLTKSRRRTCWTRSLRHRRTTRKRRDK
jgi:hypothetical protein